MSQFEQKQAQNNFQAQKENSLNEQVKQEAEIGNNKPEQQSIAVGNEILVDKAIVNQGNDVPNQQQGYNQSAEKVDFLLENVPKTLEEPKLQQRTSNGNPNVQLKKIQQLPLENKNNEIQNTLQIDQQDIQEQNVKGEQGQEHLQQIQSPKDTVHLKEEEKQMIINPKSQIQTPDIVIKKDQLQVSQSFQQHKKLDQLNHIAQNNEVNPEGGGLQKQIICEQNQTKLKNNEPISLQGQIQEGDGENEQDQKMSQQKINNIKNEIFQQSEHINNKSNQIMQNQDALKGEESEKQQQQLNLIHDPVVNHPIRQGQQNQDKGGNQITNNQTHVLQTRVSNENKPTLNHYEAEKNQFIVIEQEEKEQIINQNTPNMFIDKQQRSEDHELIKVAETSAPKQEQNKEQQNVNFLNKAQSQQRQEKQNNQIAIANHQQFQEKKYQQIHHEYQHLQNKKTDVLESRNKQVESKTIEVQLNDEPQQKHKYRLHSQYVESIPEQKHGEKQVILFTQFSQNEEPARTKTEQVANLVQIKQKTSVNKKLSLEPLSIQQNKNQLERVNVLPDVIEEQNQRHRTLAPKEQTKQQKRNDESPKKEGIGKIAKRNIYQKKVYDIVKDLTKYDQNKNVIPILDQPKRLPKKKINLSKLDSHIGLESNVLNLTIGEIMSKNEDAQANKLLEQIDLLKENLRDLQRKKEDRQYESPSRVEENSNNTINSVKRHKKQLTGRIYRKFENQNSRVSEQINNSSREQSNSIPIQPFTMNSAPRKRFFSTNGFQGFKPKQQQIINQLGKKVAPMISFRVKRSNKSTSGQLDFESPQKQAGFIKNKEKYEQDQCFQARPLQNYEHIQFTEEEKLNLIQRPSPRQPDFTLGFREEVQKYFLTLNCQTPKKEWSQQELVELAKSVFKKFGVNLQVERAVVLSVKKYKNCVSFTLDSDRTILWYYEGKFYYGGWIINKDGEGEKNGWGYEQIPGKYVYNGSYKENKKQGYGVIKFLSKQKDIVYEGFWANGLKQGIGKQLQSDGIEYVGQWRQGKKHGQGKVNISQKQSFVGNFIRGVKNGYGKQIFKNGDIFEGEYVDGKFSGKGIYTWANLSRYEGQFKNGARNGRGTWIGNYTDPNSDKYEGQYKNDKKSGFGLYRWKDGTSYEGEFLNDLKHGEGLVSYGDGRTAKLQWFQGAVLPRPVNRASSSKKGNNRANSQKTENSKNSGTNGPQKQLISQSRSKPTRISLGMQKL